MQQTKLFFRSLSGFTICICSANCKKNTDKTVPDCKIVAAVSGSNATSFTYNAEGKLSSRGNSVGTDMFAYSGNTITIYSITMAGLSKTKVVTLNMNGLALKVSETNRAGVKLSDVTYEYVGDELKKEIYATPVGDTLITTYTYSGGNLVSSQTNSQNNMFTYSKNIPAQTGDLWSISNLVQGYETVRTKNALTSIESPPGSISTINYVFDADKKITTINRISDGVLFSNNYQYECN